MEGGSKGMEHLGVKCESEISDEQKIVSWVDLPIWEWKSEDVALWALFVSKKINLRGFNKIAKLFCNLSGEDLYCMNLQNFENTIPNKDVAKIYFEALQKHKSNNINFDVLKRDVMDQFSNPLFYYTLVNGESEEHGDVQFDSEFRVDENSDYNFYNEYVSGRNSKVDGDELLNYITGILYDEEISDSIEVNCNAESNLSLSTLDEELQPKKFSGITNNKEKEETISSCKKQLNICKTSENIEEVNDLANYLMVVLGSLSDCMPKVEKEKRGPGRPPGNKKKPEGKGVKLWQFLLLLLHDERYCDHIIKWLDRDSGVFKFVNGSKVASLWGARNNYKDKCQLGKPMDYEKFTRAIRYYYEKSKIKYFLKYEREERREYQFGPEALQWWKNRCNSNRSFSFNI